MKRLWTLLLPVVLAAGLVGCGSDEETTTIRVLAAASLVDVMKPLVAAYERDHAGTKVEVDTAASSALVRRLREGEKADVLVTADTATMDGAVSAGVARDPRVVATNSLVIVAPAGNEAVKGLADFGRTDVRTVLCASEVPCGAAADKALAAANITPKPTSRAADVRATLAQVTSGEADGGIVYATDARSAGAKVRTIPLAGTSPSRYPASALTDAGTGFRDLLLSEEGRRILTDAGFGVP